MVILGSLMQIKKKEDIKKERARKNYINIWRNIGWLMKMKENMREKDKEEREEKYKLNEKEVIKVKEMKRWVKDA